MHELTRIKKIRKMRKDLQYSKRLRSNERICQIKEDMLDSYMSSQNKFKFYIDISSEVDKDVIYHLAKKYEFFIVEEKYLQATKTTRFYFKESKSH